MQRRSIAGLLLCGFAWGCFRNARGAGAPRRVALELKRFEFTPARLDGCVGETLIVELTSRDFVHGFSIPDLGVRIDAAPGRSTELRLELHRAGSFTFLCDNFCGDGHDRMTGLLLVQGACR